MKAPRIAILGGGPAGCGAAYKLRRECAAEVTLFERNERWGGNAGSFEVSGIRVDYGSHRLHSACDPDVLADIRSLLGDDLASFERHGRILIRGHWVHFPLKPLDLLLRLDRRFATGVARDMALGSLRRGNGAADHGTFASVLRSSLGPTMCEHFYFPYARKLWGREPEELSGIQARKRVSAGSFTKILKRLAKPPGNGRYWYPRRGYGQITEAYAAAAEGLGAVMLPSTSVMRIERPVHAGGRWMVHAERNGEPLLVEADHLWSTIPVTLAVRMMSPAPPAPVLGAAGSIDYRSMVLVYLELDVDRFSGTDAHYFPEGHISLTRLSEPKNYFRHEEPRGRTVLCGELPCSVEDSVWSMPDADLGRLVAEDMERAGIPLPRPPARVHVRRLRQAYPIYPHGYERPLRIVEEWTGGLPNFLSYGRQGLFAHDNTHHALYMAYAAVDCLKGAEFDLERWGQYRELFATHVVED